MSVCARIGYHCAAHGARPRCALHGGGLSGLQLPIPVQDPADPLEEEGAGFPAPAQDLLEVWLGGIRCGDDPVYPGRAGHLLLR